jgi:hypothetical protein
MRAQIILIKGFIRKTFYSGDLAGAFPEFTGGLLTTLEIWVAVKIPQALGLKVCLADTLKIALP